MHTARFVVPGYTHPPQIPYTQYSTPQKDMVPQGSHSDWKTWKNGKAFSSQGKVREF